ncbi:condensation domain-containing protein [Streptosporangium lutulentum]
MAAYNVPAAVRLRGPLNTTALLGAVRDLADRHEVLRSLVTDEGATPVDAGRVPITVEDLDDHDLLEARLQEELARPFALDSEPPSRALLLRLPGADEHVLALTVHHIAFDAWSRNLALAELSALYAARLGLAEPPAPPGVLYADYAAWLAGQPEGDLAWWAERLAGLEPVLDLPVDRARPSVADWSGATVPVRLAPALTARVREVAAETGCTPFMVLLAAWQELLGRVSGTDDVPVGVPEAGRLHPDTARMLGCFVNTLVLRGDRSGEPTGRELLARTKDSVLDALTHRDVPFERIVEHLHPERNLATTPIFQVLLNVLDDPRGRWTSPAWPWSTCRPRCAPPSTTSTSPSSTRARSTTASSPTAPTCSTSRPCGAWPLVPEPAGGHARRPGRARGGRTAGAGDRAPRLGHPDADGPDPAAACGDRRPDTEQA